MLGWVYFRSNDILQANEYVRQLFNFTPTDNSIVTHLSMMGIVVIIFGILFSGFVQRPVKALFKKLNEKGAFSQKLIAVGTKSTMVVDVCLQIAMVVASCAALVGGTYNAFIYFQF